MISPEKIAEMLAAAEHVPNGEWTFDGHEIIASRRYPIATVDRHSRDAEAIKAYLLLCHPDAISDLLASKTAAIAARELASGLLSAAEAQLARQGEALNWAMDEIDVLSNKLHGFAYPQGMKFSGRSDQLDNYRKAIDARRARSTLSPEDSHG